MESTSESYTNIPMSSLLEIIIYQSTAIRTKPHLKSKYKQCTCKLYTKFESFKKYFAKCSDDLIKLTLSCRTA